MHETPVHINDPGGKIRVVSGATLDSRDLVHDIDVPLQPYGDPLLSAWNFRPEVFSAVGVLGMIFVAGWLHLRRSNPRVVHPWQLTLYLGGLGAILLALVSPIDALAGERLSMHMVQHLLLLMIAPLFLLLANPLSPFLWGFPKKVRLRLGRLLSRTSVVRTLIRALTFMPVSWSLYVLNLWAWHHPVLYQLALRNHSVHDLQHVLFFSSAALFWWPIANPSPQLHGQYSYGWRIVYLVAAALQNTLLGMAISLPERVLYPFYAAIPRLRAFAPIDDQALGGGIMWLSGHMYLIPILVLVARMLGQEDMATRGSSSPTHQRFYG